MKIHSWRESRRLETHLDVEKKSRDDDTESVEAAFKQESCIELMPVRGEGGFGVWKGDGHKPAEPAAVIYSTSAISLCIPW